MSAKSFLWTKTGGRSNGRAVSQASGLPWTSIDQPTARTKCTDLGSGFDLIKNTEWMTTAVNIENLASNWTGGVVGSGSLYRGHSDNTPNSALAATTEDTDGYSGTGNTSGDQRRTFILSNGQVIWDLSGNVWSWVLWNLSTDPTTIIPSTTLMNNKATPAVAAWEELTATTPNATNMPTNSYMPSHGTYNSAQGAGQYWPGTIGSGGGALRGVGYGNVTSNYGIFGLHLGVDANYTNQNVGFRCAFSAP